MTQEQPVIRIGELLVLSGVITAYDLSEAEKLSSHMKVQFGRLLIMAGCLTEEALECALEAQGLIKQGMLNPQIASEALAFAVQENIPLRQSLEMLDCLPQFGTSTLRLAELIHDANILDEERLHDAFDTSMETNKPLPEVLVEMDCISPGLLSIMLRMQEQIRNETLDREDSINELRGTFKIWKRADKAMANDPMSKSAIIGAAPTEPIKTSRYTSSFDSVTRLPAMSPEILAALSKEAAAGTVSGASNPSVPAAQNQSAQNFDVTPHTPSVSSQPSAGAPGAGRANAPTGASNDPRSKSDPTRGGKNNDLNVDWILQDYANAPPGQPMPDGVILYSQGYFPPDPANATNEEPFNEVFSDEDEQRINDLLDVFSDDAGPGGIETHPGVASSSSSDRYTSHSGAGLQSYSPPGTNFAQASYSASLAAAAADGWGVPDLAAAGANLSGAEMFARAQAELASSGWAYSQGNSSQVGHANQQLTPQKLVEPPLPDKTPPGSFSPAAFASPSVSPAQPLMTPGPLGQPTFVTPAAPVPQKGLGHPDFYPGELARTTSPDSDSLFSPQLRDSISDALDTNPFKIRKATGTDPNPESQNPHSQNPPVENKNEDKAVSISEAVSAEIADVVTTESKTTNPEDSNANFAAPQSRANDNKSEASENGIPEDKENEDHLKSESQETRNLDSSNFHSASENSHVNDGVASEHSSDDSAEITSEVTSEATSEATSEVAAELKSETSYAEIANAINVTPAEAQPATAATAETNEPRGKFGTKTGLAARRKAIETDEPTGRNDVVYLLKSANFFTADELEDAVVSCLRDPNKAVEILAILGIIDKSNLDAAVRLQKLVKSGSVELEKAVESLSNLKSGKIRASELTEQLGIKKAKRRK